MKMTFYPHQFHRLGEVNAVHRHKQEDSHNWERKCTGLQWKAEENKHHPNQHHHQLNVDLWIRNLWPVNITLKTSVIANRIMLALTSRNRQERKALNANDIAYLRISCLYAGSLALSNCLITMNGRISREMHTNTCSKYAESKTNR